MPDAVAVPSVRPIRSPPEDIERLKKTPEYAQTKERLIDREWRIDNLYRIINENGTEVKFVRNAAQRIYMRSRHSRDLITKARQLGFSTLIEMLICDACTFRSHITAGIVDHTLDDAKVKLAKIEFAYSGLSEHIRAANPLIKNNTEELHWANGSKVSVGTSYRGDTAQIIHVSELGRTAIEKPDAAREVRKGSLRAIHANGWAVVESTAHGTAGEFHDMVRAAEAAQKQGRTLTPLEFKLHFYGWWLKPEYSLPNNLMVVSQELRTYFTEVNAKLLARNGITLDANQQAWYAFQHNDLGPDDVREEFPTLIEECFFNSLKGAFWRDEINRARTEGRIGGMVPHDPTRRVNTLWDIGEDCTAIIFHQTDGLRHRYIDYYEEEGGSLQRAAGVLDEKRRERGFVYGRHLGPHDLNHRDWANNAQSRYQTAIDLGIKFEVVPQVGDKADSIEAGRRMLNMLWVDEEHCGLVVERMENYSKKWNKTLQVFSSEPVHNMSSHCFVGETKILTPDGLQRIKDLPKTGEVLTLCGIKGYHSPRITRRAAPLVEVKFKNGISVKCTPEHMFLTPNGWKSAESLRPGGAILSRLMTTANFSTGRYLGATPVRRISLMGAERSIASCGRWLSEKYRRGVTFIIGIATNRITDWRILNAFRCQNIFALHGASVPLGGWLQKSAPMLGVGRRSGMGPQTASGGTENMRLDQKVGKSGRARKENAPHATRSLWPSLEAAAILKSIVPRTADSLLIENVTPLKERSDVWCITVPDIEHFCLENGAVVHNCSDAHQQGAMGLGSEKVPREDRRPRERKASPWSA